MAYMDFDFARAAAVRLAGPVTAPDTPARFSALERSVIALAERDRPSSLRQPSFLSTVIGALFSGHNPRLADPRLEALRRMAVLSWRRGYSVPPHEVRSFVGAGYSPAHYEALLDSIFAARRAAR